MFAPPTPAQPSVSAEAQPEPPPALPFLALVFVVAAFTTLGGFAQALNLAFGLWFSEVFIFLGIGWVLTRLAPLDPVRFTGLAALSRRGAALGFGLGVINYFAWAVPLMALAQHVLPEALVQRFDGSAIFKDRTPTQLAFLVAGVGLAAPFCEEFFFRGVVQGSLVARVSPPRAVLATAIIFSALHFDPVGFAARVELGVLFGVLAWRTGSIWPGVFAHAANNLVSCAAYFAGVDGPEGPLDGLAAAGLWLVGNAVLIGATVLLRRHPRWLETWTGSPARVEVRPRLASLAWPWILGAGASVALLLAIDGRGVRLSLIDLSNPISGAHAQEAFRVLREQADRGDLSLEAYEGARRAARQAPTDPGADR